MQVLKPAQPNQLNNYVAINRKPVFTASVQLCNTSAGRVAKSRSAVTHLHCSKGDKEKEDEDTRGYDLPEGLLDQAFSRVFELIMMPDGEHAAEAEVYLGVSVKKWLRV